MTSSRTTTLRSLRLLPVAAVAILALAACGDNSSTGGASDGSAPTSSSAPTADAAGTIVVTAKDFSFDKAAITAPAGMVTITMVNMGHATHEFVLLKTDADPTSLAVGPDGKVDESNSVGEISETDGGDSGTHTFDLKAGKYVFVCNIPGHYKDGMAGELTVSQPG